MNCAILVTQRYFMDVKKFQIFGYINKFVVDCVLLVIQISVHTFVKFWVSRCGWFIDFGYIVSSGVESFLNYRQCLKEYTNKWKWMKQIRTMKQMKTCSDYIWLCACMSVHIFCREKDLGIIDLTITNLRRQKSVRICSCSSSHTRFNLKVTIKSSNWSTFICPSVVKDRSSY